jgi:hypothetical protein
MSTLHPQRATLLDADGGARAVLGPTSSAEADAVRGLSV